MAKLTKLHVFHAALCCLAILAEPGNAVLQHLRPKDSSAGSTYPISGYTVPVQGAYESLPLPQPEAVLTFLTLARGNISYSCEGRKPAQSPVYTSQSTTLWDAAPLLPHITDENEFHFIIPQLYAFDYAQISNSSLTCVGTIGTVNGQPIVDLLGVGLLKLAVQQTIQGPDQYKANLNWAYETSDDWRWEVYRVETISDTLSGNCQGREGPFAIDYAAEYWFFRSNSMR